MTLKFRSVEARDALANRLVGLVNTIIGARSQGHDGRVAFTDEAVDDIRAAAAIVATCDIQSPDPEDDYADRAEWKERR